MRSLTKDKRQALRLAAHHLLKYKVLNEAGGSGTLSFVRNISANGALFHCHEYIKPETILRLTINFPQTPKSLEATARVLRTKKLSKDRGFDIAVQFINLEEEYKVLMGKKIINTFDKVKNKKPLNFIIVSFIILVIAGVIIALFIKLISVPRV
jgi:hypothetical protein